jgi:GT2 family glycosyltransferase
MLVRRWRRRCLPVVETHVQMTSIPFPIAIPSYERLVIVVPVRNQSSEITACLDALDRAGATPDEIFVVDDASTDDTASVASARGVHVARREHRGGPAAARNTGVAVAGKADIILFVDSDVVIASDVIRRVKAALSDPTMAAVFGSYDAEPVAPGIVSRYRNLLHHFVHQRGSPEARTFWAGCGAVRYTAFLRLGGFDEAARWNFIEDIELGHRMSRAGMRIRLDKQLRATHLKRWTLSSMIRTDILYRARPWSHLLLDDGAIPNDLNLTWSQRASVALSSLACGGLLVAPVFAQTALPAAIALSFVVALNWNLFGFLRRTGGTSFAALCVPLHVVHNCCAALGFGWAWSERLLEALRQLGSKDAGPRSRQPRDQHCSADLPPPQGNGG